MTDGEGDRGRREGENERFFGESSLILSVSGKLLSLRDFPSHTHNVLSVCLSDCCVYLLSRVAVVVVSAGVEFVWENGDTLLLLLLSTVLTAGASRFPGGDVGISVDCVCVATMQCCPPQALVARSSLTHSQCQLPLSYELGFAT